MILCFCCCCGVVGAPPAAAAFYAPRIAAVLIAAARSGQSPAAVHGPFPYGLCPANHWCNMHTGIVIACHAGRWATPGSSERKHCLCQLGWHNAPNGPPGCLGNATHLTPNGSFPPLFVWSGARVEEGLGVV